MKCLIRTLRQKKSVEQFVELCFGFAVRDVNGFQNRLIESTPYFGARFEVCVVAIAGESYGERQNLLPSLEVGFGGFKFCSCTLLGFGDPVLFTLQ